MNQAARRPPNITERDQHVLRWFHYFPQLTASQVAELVFDKRYTPANRSLRRLIASNHLIRMTIRGSSQFIYRRKDGRRAVDFHGLTIVDCFLELRRAEQRGELVLTMLTCEPDCWLEIDSYDLRPDMFVEIQRPHDGLRTRRFMEIDLGSEGHRQIRVKLETYVNAYYKATDAQWKPGHVVTWVAVDERRAAELRWLIKQIPAEHQPLFEVVLLEQVAQVFYPQE